MKIEIFPRMTWKGRRWFFRIKAANHKIVAQSEGYHNRGDCVCTALTLRRELFNAEVTYG